MPTIKKKKNSRKLIFSIANTLCIDLLSADIWQTRKKDCRELLADWNNLPLYSLVNVIYHCYIFLPVNLDLTGRKCGQIKKKKKRSILSEQHLHLAARSWSGQVKVKYSKTVTMMETTCQMNPRMNCLSSYIGWEVQAEKYSGFLQPE